MNSLYDKFYSKENVSHMYKLLVEILTNNYGISLNTIEDYNKYMNNFNIVFNNTNSDNLVDINKELLSSNIKFFINDKNNNQNNNLNNNQNNNQNNYNNRTEETNLINQNNYEAKNEPNLTLKYNEFIQERPNELMINNINENNENKQNTIILSSSNRNNKTSRFNYTVKNIKQVLSFDKLIIPIENTNHFTSPLLKLIINEINFNSILHLKETYELNNYTYGIYYPENNKIFQNSDKLTIQILSIFEDEEYLPDIYECYNDNNIITGNYDIDDFKENDIIQIRFGEDYNQTEYSKIISLNSDEIEIEGLKNDIGKCFILNMNLQNTLLFN